MAGNPPAAGKSKAGRSKARESKARDSKAGKSQAGGRPEAHVSHAAPGRLRIRVPGRRGDGVYFARAEERFGACPEVHRVAVNPLTGSILIEHTTDMAAIGRFAENNDLLVLQAAPAVVPLGVTLRAGVVDLDTRVRRAAGGTLDLWSAVSVVYLALACIQLFRGYSMGPATALLWTGLSAMRMASENSATDDDGS